MSGRTHNSSHIFERNNVQGIHNKGGEPFAAFPVPVVVAEHRLVNVALQVVP